MTDEKIYKLIKLFIWLLGKLPMGVSQFISDSIGILWFFSDKRHRQVTLNNLNYAYGNDLPAIEIRKLGEKVFKNIASILFETAWSTHLTQTQLMSHFTIKGIEHLENARKKGRGVIILSGHIGNFELSGAALGNLDFTIHGVYRKLDYSPLERLMLERRERFGVHFIPLKGAAKKLDVILRKGGVIGSLLDQNAAWYRGPFVNFFGKPACTNSGLASMALRTKASVVPVYTVRNNRKFLIEFLPEIELEETGDRIKDLENNTQNYTSAIESMVRKHPDQYFWVHNRWKTKPYCIYPKNIKATVVLQEN